MVNQYRPGKHVEIPNAVLKSYGYASLHTNSLTEIADYEFFMGVFKGLTRIGGQCSLCSAAQIKVSSLNVRLIPLPDSNIRPPIALFETSS